MQASQRQISELIRCNDRFNVVFHDDEFNQALNECGDSQIMIIPIIGPFQIGKSTFLSVLLGMNTIQIGNGIDDETMGVTFYGPIRFQDFLSRFGLTSHLTEDIKLIFADTQGYGGWKSGDGDSNINNTRLLSSIIPLSQILLLYTDSNDTNTNIQTLQDFFELMKCCYESFNPADFQIINLIKLHGRINNFDYGNPTQDQYNQLSEELKTIQTGKYLNLNINKFLPYPKYDNEAENPSDNLLNESFRNGFRFILTDLVQSIETMAPRLNLNAERIRAIHNLYSKATGANYSLELFANQSRKNVDMEILRKSINIEINKVIRTHFNQLDEEIRNIKRHASYPFIENDFELDFTLRFNDDLNRLNSKIRDFSDHNLSYQTELWQFSLDRIQIDFIDAFVSKLDAFSNQLNADRVNSASEELEKSLRSIRNTTWSKIQEFTKRNENQFKWDLFETCSNRAIEAELDKCKSFHINKSGIERIRHQGEQIKAQFEIDLVCDLRTVVNRNIEEHTANLARMTQNIAETRESIDNFVTGLVTVAKLDKTISEFLTS